MAHTRRTAIIIAGLTIFVSLLLLAVVALSGGAMNRAAQTTEEHFITRELERTIAGVLDEQKSVALWDEAVVRIRARDMDWLDAEIGAYLNGSYGHDEIYLFDRHDQPVYAYPRQNEKNAVGMERIREVAAPLLEEIRLGTKRPSMRARSQDFIATHDIPDEIMGASALRWSAHLLKLDGQPAIVSAMSVIPTTPSRTTAGRPPVIVSILRLDAAKLHALGKAASIPDLHLNRAEVHSNVMAGIQFDADDGKPIGTLEWTPGHPGKKLLTYILPLLVLGTLWALYATLTMLRRLMDMARGLENSEQEARRLAHYDMLSGLPNRHKFVLSLNEWLRAWQEGKGERPLVAYIDLDHFKEVNDTLGHDTGDALVRAVSRILSAALPGPFAGPFGGRRIRCADDYSGSFGWLEAGARTVHGLYRADTGG